MYHVLYILALTGVNKEFNIKILPNIHHIQRVSLWYEF